MTSRKSWWAPLLGAAIALLGSCGTTAAPSSTSQPTPLPTSPSPPASQLSIATKCGGPFHPGQYVGLACVVSVQDTPNNPINGVYADRSIFGGTGQSGVVKCPACGGPPWTFDLDVRIPANMTPGVKTFAVWAIYANGSRAETTASIEIVGPPSQLTVSTKCFGPVHPGQDIPVACMVLVEDVNYPQELRFDVWADLRIFGGPAEVQAVQGCSGCIGGPPWAYVLQLHIPANITPGVKTFAVWASNVYANEHGADTTASIEIVAP